MLINLISEHFAEYVGFEDCGFQIRMGAGFWEGFRLGRFLFRVGAVQDLQVFGRVGAGIIGDGWAAIAKHGEKCCFAL